jgi:A/G-specific adenine glycosylase
LLNWFTANARDLPWRRTRDPYAVWVSEIMLQQTQVKTVIPYFERWMRELPNVHALANASSEKIHKLWEGLGYYTRVRNMQKAAQSILENQGGKFPHNYEDILALPGIGRYTAGAISSIAYNEATPILDGNVIRVLTRVFGIRENARATETMARLWQMADQLVQAAQHRSRFIIHDSHIGPCSAFNQSLMELGALICTPRQPQCEACPVSRLCIARREGVVEQLPNLGVRPAATARRFAACVIEHGEKVFVRQRPAGVVNGHLWEFPNVETGIKTSRRATRRHLEVELGCTFEALTPLTVVKHTITRYRITLEAYRAQLNGALPRQEAGEWILKSELEPLPFTSAHRRVWTAALTSSAPHR